jgi:hypothetical protein
MLERVEARDDTAGAVTKHVNGNLGVTGARDSDEAIDVADIVVERLHVEALAV